MDLHGIPLKKAKLDVPFDPLKCIICQKDTNDDPKGTELGRQQMIIAAEVRDDIVKARLDSITNNIFFYHSSNECYKTYTHKQKLDKIRQEKLKNVSPNEPQNETKRILKTRSKVTPRCRSYGAPALERVLQGQWNRQVS